ncbi:DNRLRE domain-containing protein [Streptomyces sp. NPDC051064]|uniref:DNRLRE domain-containing protein n=1 Tax=Streptomyces sp. NPDC051064 TaxID=3365641 RepID=UPI0037AF56AC
MSPYRSSRSRQRARIATGAALLLVAEAALVAGGSASAAPAPEPRPAGQAESAGPSKADLLKSDLAWAAERARGSKAWALTEAERTGKKTVATDETTPTTYTLANPDGTLTTELTAGPERVWKNGTWQRADATLTKAADGSITPKAHPNGLRLSGKSGTLPKSLRAGQDDTARDLVTLGSGDSKVTLQWKGGLPQPDLDGTRARYKDAVPGADVIIEATRTGFEQFVEIDERPTGAYFYTLPVQTNGLKAKANKDGSVTFTDAKSGAERATMPAPVMWDAAVDKTSGEHMNRARVDMKVVSKGAGRVDLVVTPSAEFLADPDTKFPVTVDPSTSALSNTFDTYVQQGETVDWSTDTELDLGNPGTKNADGTPRTARSFITWNTTPIQDALIVDTNLALWNFHSGNTDCTNQSWTVWDTSAPSTSSRWTSQPTWNQQYHSSTQTRGNPDCTATQPDGWINADVDSLVQSWASAKATRGHMGLRAATDDVKAWKRVNSANNAANQPKLSVTYNYRPSDGMDRQAGAPFRSYAGVWAVNTTTPTLRDTFTDPDADKVNGTFQVYDAATNTPITTPAGEGLIVSSFVDSGKPASVTVPAGQLTDGKTYKFRTNAYDGTHYNLSWSPWTQFVVDTTAPDEPRSVSSADYPENWGGGGAGIVGTFDVTTGDASPYEVQYRFDPFEDDADDYGWSSVHTTTPALSGRAVAPEASYTATPAADGNHVTQTRTVDRAGNVGPIKDYGFTAGNRDYNRAQKIDVKLPQPDLTSDVAAYLNDPQRIADWKQGSSSRTLSKGGETVTITPKDEQSLEGTRKAAKELAARERMRAPSYPDPVVTSSWCQPSLSGEAQKSLITRNEACVFFDLNYSKKYYLNGVETEEHHAKFEIAFQVKTDRHDGTIKTWIQMNPVYNDFPGHDRSVLFGDGNPIAHIDSMCYSAACEGATDSRDVKNFDFYNDLSWKGGGDGTPTDSHMATGTATHKWDGSTAGAGPSDAALSRDLPVWFIFNPESEYEPLEGKDDEIDSGDSRSPGIDVRCDKVSSYGVPGCVLTQYVPEYQMDAARYPAAAAHLWMVQNKSGIKGLGTIGKPLHYRPDADNGRVVSTWTKKKIRSRVCGYYGGTRTDGYVPTKGFVAHPKTFLHSEFRPQVPLPNPDKVNCDEVPFASTYESVGLPASAGGMNPAGTAGGGECIQTVAAKADDGSEHLLDDTRYDAPTFSEKCGRSSMSGFVNQGAMSKYGNEFLAQMRVIDGDEYAVDPGRLWFSNCDTGGLNLICEMKKP